MQQTERARKNFSPSPSITLLSLVLFLTLRSHAAEWQWSLSIDAIQLQDSQHPRAFLWIPPECEQVRAIVVGQNNMIEEGILEHREFRKTLARLGIAEIYIAPTFDNWQNATNNTAANERFNALLKSFANDSGYAELEFAPIIPIGHSAMASFPWNFAAWNPARTLAILSIHGDAPQTTLVGNGRPNVDWGNRNIDGIPGLMVMGEYEWWEDRLTPLFAFRAKHPATPLAVLCDSGHGHFDYSDDLVKFLAMYIRKAAERRLPLERGFPKPQHAGNTNDHRIVLKPVKPGDGWLMDRWRKNELSRAQAAPFENFSGNTNEAFWCFDSEMARAEENFNPQFGKQPQLVGFVQDGKIVDQRPNTHAQVYLKMPPLGDSLTFKLTGAFLDTVPAGGNPAKWTGLTNGAPLTHASGGGPVVLSRISGPVLQTAPDQFAIRFNRSSIPVDRRAGDIWLLASHPGDRRYKSAVQQAILTIPMKLNEGTDQRIYFPEIPDQRAGVKSLRLHATTDSGAPVYYYVRGGPAEVDGSTLRFTEIPPRGKFPIAVTVVAWQYGRTTGQKLKTAEPVERTFFITKSNDKFSVLTEKIQSWVDRGYYPGAAMLVAKDNKIIYERCFGNFSPDTEVLIASSGKWLAAAVIMSLVDEGKLSLDDTASKWLPELRNDPKGGATLRQMLSHTSGYTPYQPKDRPTDNYQTLTESVAHIVPLPPDYQPGERFDYGGLAMQVAGRMAEVATGKDWETIFQERIARSCRMTNTHFVPVDQGGGHSPMLGGGARSNLRDYANFLSMIFNDGRFEGRRVLSERAIREMQADQLRGALVKQPEFVQRVRGNTHNAIYGLGEWREELDAKGNAVLISSPSWAGAYPWIDKTTGVYGVFLAHIDTSRPNPERFSGFYSSPVLAEIVRNIAAEK
jgi:CubicO group peptidase (beta-lactamase class C family)